MHGINRVNGLQRYILPSEGIHLLSQLRRILPQYELHLLVFTQEIDDNLRRVGQPSSVVCH